jgi:hypothetical protein
MRRGILTVGLVAFFAAPVAALSGGPGGYVYFSRAATTGGTFDQYLLYQLAFDEQWNAIGGPANFDNVDHDSSYGSWNNFQRRSTLEVLDPRHEGGTGTLIQPAVNNLTPYEATSYNRPWDLVRVDPTGPTQTILCDGRMGTAFWTTRHLGPALAAPTTWPGGGDNVIGVVTMQGIWGTDMMYQWDANGNGTLDNGTNEGTQILNRGGQAYDVEVGADAAVYFADPAGDGQIYRTWVDAGGTGHNQLYYDLDPVKPLTVHTDGFGLAAGQLGSGPVIYVFAMDNVEALGQVPTVSRASILALQDKNDDNDAEDPGEVFQVWRDGDFGIDVYNGIYGGEDIEYYRNPDNGDQFLVFSDYYGGLWVLELADNGVSAVDGKRIASLPSDWGYQSGFELDLNPGEVIPEPTTLLLLGTGALGAIGYVRRRRMH